MANKKQELSITVKKEEDLSEWYTQVILKSDLIDYSKVSGCIVYKPNSYQIWEKIKDFVDIRFKKIGIKNAYFPLFIPESLLAKEEEHVEGFTPEVAWVTKTGDSELAERLAIRPTSETIMYDSYSKWIKSYRDLPLRLNQWNNVVRWEFKHSTPFLRSREFLWNEGHTVFATKEEAEAEKNQILSIYEEALHDLMAIYSIKGQKSQKEKFAGAEATFSHECFLETGKAIQGPDFHLDGQNFAKAFDIKFMDEKGKEQYAWQNTFAITTRMIGVMIMAHSDNKGLVLPPKLAENKVVIIPLLFKDKEKEVLEIANKIKENFPEEFNAFVDDRENVSAGFKFNEWEIKGIPIRIEVGPRDIEKNEIVIVERDTGEKYRTKLNLKLFNFETNTCKVEKSIQRRANVAVILENNNNEILCLDWHNKEKWKSFVIGGQDDLELKAAAEKELKEETGYQNVEFVRELDVETHDKFFAPHKDVNRHAITKTLVFKLKDEQKVEIEENEKKLHTPIWVKKEKVAEFLSIDAMKFIWDSYLGKRQKYDSLSVLIADFLDIMQERMYKKSKEFTKSKINICDDLKSYEKSLKNELWPLVKWCGDVACEESIKEKYGAKSNNIPFEQPKKVEGSCVFCKNKAKYYALIAKSL